MLALESTRWAELTHAYGKATDTPGLLRLLYDLPTSENNAEPWFSIWNSLAHQGDVYSASFAAVPHVISAAAKAPNDADVSYFHFPAWVEICRSRENVEIPADLREAYFAAMAKMPGLINAASSRLEDTDFLRCAFAAIAVANRQPVVAEAALELTPEVAGEFLEWFSSR